MPERSRGYARIERIMYRESARLLSTRSKRQGFIGRKTRAEDQSVPVVTTQCKKQRKRRSSRPPIFAIHAVEKNAEKKRLGYLRKIASGKVLTCTRDPSGGNGGPSSPLQAISTIKSENNP